MSKLDVSGEDIYRRKQSTGETWNDISKDLGVSVSTLKRRSKEYREESGLPYIGSTRTIIGTLDEEPIETPEEIWSRAIRVQQRKERRINYNNTRELIFDEGPIVLVAMADLHLGNAGTKYSELEKDFAVLKHLSDAGVPVALILVGDLIDNYIVGRLQQLRMKASPFLTIEEWGLVDYALEKITPYLVGSVAGNHDNWAWALSGIDILRDRHRYLTPGIMYDPFELAFTLRVGKFSTRVMARHIWAGHSKFNPTHAIDDWQRRRGRDFDIAIGGHTHRGGLAREFDNGGKVGHIMLCGSYKKDDEFGQMVGLPPNLPSSAVAAVISQHGVEYATSNLSGIVDRFIVNYFKK